MIQMNPFRGIDQKKLLFEKNYNKMKAPVVFKSQNKVTSPSKANGFSHNQYNNNTRKKHALITPNISSQGNNQLNNPRSNLSTNLNKSIIGLDDYQYHLRGIDWKQIAENQQRMRLKKYGTESLRYVNYYASPEYNNLKNLNEEYYGNSHQNNQSNDQYNLMERQLKIKNPLLRKQSNFSQSGIDEFRNHKGIDHIMEGGQTGSPTFESQGGDSAQNKIPNWNQYISFPQGLNEDIFPQNGFKNHQDNGPLNPKSLQSVQQVDESSYCMTHNKNQLPDYIRVKLKTYYRIKI